MFFLHFLVKIAADIVEQQQNLALANFNREMLLFSVVRLDCRFNRSPFRARQYGIGFINYLLVIHYRGVTFLLIYL